MGDDWAKDGLALVHGQEIGDSTGAVFVEGARVLEEIENSGQDLDRGDGGIELDGGKTRVGLWMYMLGLV